MLCQCTVIMSYWLELLSLISATVGVPIQRTHAVFLLGLMRLHKAQKEQLRFIDLPLLLTKQSITMRWRSAGPPQLHGWHGVVV